MTQETSDDTRSVVHCERTATGEELADLMDNYKVGCVVVVENNSPVGIVTDRDLAIALGTSRMEATELVAEDVMRTPLTTIEAGSSLLQVIQTMSSANVRRLPVVDETDQLVDIITMDDIIALTAETLHGLGDVIESESPPADLRFN
jgi:CBS domain-containing protein